MPTVTAFILDVLWSHSPGQAIVALEDDRGQRFRAIGHLEPETLIPGLCMRIEGNWTPDLTDPSLLSIEHARPSLPKQEIHIAALLIHTLSMDVEAAMDRARRHQQRLWTMLDQDRIALAHWLSESQTQTLAALQSRLAHHCAQTAKPTSKPASAPAPINPYSAYLQDQSIPFLEAFKQATKMRLPTQDAQKIQAAGIAATRRAYLTDGKTCLTRRELEAAITDLLHIKHLPRSAWRDIQTISPAILCITDQTVSLAHLRKAERRCLEHALKWQQPLSYQTAMLFEDKVLDTAFASLEQRDAFKRLTHSRLTLITCDSQTHADQVLSQTIELLCNEMAEVALVSARPLHAARRSRFAPRDDGLHITTLQALQSGEAADQGILNEHGHFSAEFVCLLDADLWSPARFAALCHFVHLETRVSLWSKPKPFATHITQS